MTDPVQIMTQGQPPRTRSMLVTIFGDLALADGASLSGTDLAALTEPMGIQAPALRTALHRLRGDGWIESIRQGRQTSHALTPAARAQSRTAAPRIFGAAPPKTLYLILTEPGVAAPPDAVPVAPGMGLAAGPMGFALPLTAIPDWMQAAICPVDLLTETARLADAFQALTRISGPDPVLRLLVVHGWRRIVLRTPNLPDAAFPAAWRGAEARSALRDLLVRLPRPAQITSSIATP